MGIVKRDRIVLMETSFEAVVEPSRAISSVFTASGSPFFSSSGSALGANFSANIPVRAAEGVAAQIRTVVNAVA